MTRTGDNGRRTIWDGRWFEILFRINQIVLPIVVIVGGWTFKNIYELRIWQAETSSNRFTQSDGSELRRSIDLQVINTEARLRDSIVAIDEKYNTRFATVPTASDILRLQSQQDKNTTLLQQIAVDVAAIKARQQ